MSDSNSTASRFKACRERAGLSHEEVAHQFGSSPECIWDIEAVDRELAACYSPAEVGRFAKILRAPAVELFGCSGSGTPLSAHELVALIRVECARRSVSLEQFEEAVGWRLSACIDPPSRLLEDITIDGLQWLCEELRVDWHRVVLAI